MPKIKVIPLLESFFKNKGKISELWKTINEMLKTRENEIPVFCAYIKHKINGYDKQNSLLALDFIDFCVDYGNMNLWSQLNSNDFLSSLITNLKTREDTEIQSKILFLIEKWSKKFEKYYTELTNFQNIYILLKKNNIEFPINMQSEYNKYIKFIIINNNNINNNDYKNINYHNNNKMNKKETDPETYLRDINLDLNSSSYDKKYKRLVNKLYDWTHDIHEINVLINKNNRGINNNKISGLIKDLSNGNRLLIETIQSGRLKDETLMNISLNVSSDIDMTLRRWVNHKKGIYPNPFISSFYRNENNFKNNDNNSNYESSNNINYDQNNYNKSNNIDLKDFYNINNNTTIINRNMNNNINYNKTIGNNNKISFNLLVDFDCAPLTNNNNFNNNSLDLNNKNNINNFLDFVTETEMKNQIFNNKNYNNSIFKDNNFNCLNNNNEDRTFNYKDNMMNINNNLNIDDLFNNNISNFEKNDFESNNVDITRQSIMYPTFDELNQS